MFTCGSDPCKLEQCNQNHTIDVQVRLYQHMHRSHDPWVQWIWGRQVHKKPPWKPFENRNVLFQCLLSCRVTWEVCNCPLASLIRSDKLCLIVTWSGDELAVLPLLAHLLSTIERRPKAAGVLWQVVGSPTQLFQNCNLPNFSRNYFTARSTRARKRAMAGKDRCWLGTGFDPRRRGLGCNPPCASACLQRLSFHLRVCISLFL